MDNSVFLATLSIYMNPSNMAQGVESLQLIFTDFPSTDDLRQQLGEDRFLGLVDSCEVEEISEFQDSIVEGSETVAFQCINSDDVVVGAIVLERKGLLAASTLSIE